MSPDDFHRRLLRTVARWSMLPFGGNIGIAVSGGADSVALFRALLALSSQNRWTLTVLHVNHGLRAAESDADELFVRALAENERIDCKCAHLPIGERGNLEQEARQLRYAWFKQCTIAHNLHNVALGHTRSDQAETVLFRFLRGSGTTGLAGIHPVLGSGIVRPLIEITRDQVRNYLGLIAQPWREDTSNRDPSFDRNRIRASLMPQLTRDWNPELEAALANTARLARDDEEYWETLVASLAREHFVAAPGPAIVCRADLLRTDPDAVSGRLIREAVRRVSGDLRSIDFAHVENIRTLLAEHEGSGRLQIPGLDVMRSFDWVRFALPGSYDGERRYSAPASIPGKTDLPSGLSLTLQVEDADYLYNGSVNCIDADRIPHPLVLRTWQPGDQYRPAGAVSAAKIKSMFQEARIPLWDRRLWPVLVMDPGEPRETIVWARRFGVAAEFAPVPATQRYVTVDENPQNWNQNRSSGVYRS